MRRRAHPESTQHGSAATRSRGHFGGSNARSMRSALRGDAGTERAPGRGTRRTTATRTVRSPRATKRCARFAERTKARRVLDLGAHRGALLETVCRAYAPEHAVALDIDPGCASALCERFSRAPVTVLESDLMDERSGEALTERLGAFDASLTLACGLVHHLALANGDGLERATRALSRSAGRARGAVLIVEWIPESDA